MKSTVIHRIALVLLCAGMVPLLSCGILGGNLPSRNYYELKIVTSPASNTPSEPGDHYPFSLQIQQFDVQRIYSRQNIVYRYTPWELRWYEYQQWAVRPDYMITDLVYKYFESEGLFNRVGTEFLENRPDFRLEGTIDAIERLDSGDLIFGHLGMSLKMVRIADGQQVWEYSFDERKQVYQTEMQYTVIALSQIMQTQLNIVSSQIDSLLASMVGGTPRRSAPTRIGEPSPAPKDTTGAKAASPGYEIIPESSIKRK
jgi:ABC-type uncharacterized transport system auxiliary subunit